MIGQPAAPAVPALLTCLKDARWEVRQNAAEALGNIGVTDDSTIGALQGLTTDPIETVRLSAQASLAKLTAAKT